MSQVLLRAPAPDVTYSAADGTPYIADGYSLLHAFERHVASLLGHGCVLASEVVDAVVAAVEPEPEVPVEDPAPKSTKKESPASLEVVPQAPVEAPAPDPAPEKA